MIRIFSIAQILLFLFITTSFAEKVNKIIISGNERISNETLLMFGEVSLNDNLNKKDLNIITRNLYETNFFKDIKVSLINNILKINVIENPIIQSIEINGIKAKKIKEPIIENLSLKNNNSFIEYLAKKDKNLIVNLLKNSGYYFADVKLSIANNPNNTVTLIYDVNLGEKSKIRKIKFIGDKRFKNRKLYNVIVSEESKAWKFLSSRKLLNKERIDLDTRLLESYYKNKGYYNVKVENSFAQFLDENKFDLIFKINAGEKYYFNNLKLNLPVGYNREHFSKIDSTMLKLKEKPYSFNRIEKILDKIEEVALRDQYESITATVQENIKADNKIDFLITIDE